jgi:hypothetical protein
VTALTANAELRTAIPDKVRKAQKDRVRARIDYLSTGAAVAAANTR